MKIWVKMKKLFGWAAEDLLTVFFGSDAAVRGNTVVPISCPTGGGFPIGLWTADG